MKIGLTREELLHKIRHMPATEILDFLVASGLELYPPMPDLKDGIYRRSAGQDMARCMNGRWNRVNFEESSGRSEIVWSLTPGYNNIWVLVLDANNHPVHDGLKIVMDGNGNRVG